MRLPDDPVENPPGIASPQPPIVRSRSVPPRSEPRRPSIERLPTDRFAAEAKPAATPVHLGTPPRPSSKNSHASSPATEPPSSCEVTPVRLPELPADEVGEQSPPRKIPMKIPDVKVISADESSAPQASSAGQSSAPKQVGLVRTATEPSMLPAEPSPGKRLPRTESAGSAGYHLGRTESAPANLAADSILRATAAELKLPGKHKPWFDDRSSGQELATLVCESNLTPRVRGAVADAAGLGKDSTQEAAALQQTMQAGHSPVTVDTGSFPVAPLPFRERLRQALPAANVQQQVDWSRLVAVEPLETLGRTVEPELPEVLEPLPNGKKRRPKAVCVDVNSGGQVFFGLLAPKPGDCHEEAVVIKFCNSRHMLQSEQMAAELAWHLEIAAPASRILLKVHDGPEWQELSDNAMSFCENLSATLAKKQSMLLMQFVHGKNLQTETSVWQAGERLTDATRAIGRLFVLDLLLGNADRLPIKSLNWRGNPSNVLWSSQRNSPCSDANKDSGAPAGGQCVPIDAVVARRPPKLLVQEIDQKAAGLIELMLLERRTAHQVLLEAVSCNSAATAAVEADWAPTEPAWVARAKEAAEGWDESIPAQPMSAVKAFHEGVRCALGQATRELGLLEMVAEVLRSWLDALRADLGEVSAKRTGLSATKDLQEWTRLASKNDEVQDRLSSWQTLLEEKSLLLRQAADDWASRREVKTALSFRGFIGDSVINPVADAHELLVRLEQLIPRSKVLQNASSVTRPSDLSPTPIFVGPATASCCYHLLHKLGVTCIVNCTTDLPRPDDDVLEGRFTWHRLSLQDTEDQNLAECLEEGLRLIDEAVAAGGRVLIHCHEGKSRSVSLCLAYLMTREKRTLRESLDFVKSRRPPSRPNAGFLKQLLALELETLGSNSMGPEDLPKGKPKLASAKPKLASADA